MTTTPHDALVTVIAEAVNDCLRDVPVIDLIAYPRTLTYAIATALAPHLAEREKEAALAMTERFQYKGWADALLPVELHQRPTRTAQKVTEWMRADIATHYPEDTGAG